MKQGILLTKRLSVSLQGFYHIHHNCTFILTTFSFQGHYTSNNTLFEISFLNCVFGFSPQIHEKWKWKSLNCVHLFATSRTTQSMEFSGPQNTYLVSNKKLLIQTSINSHRPYSLQNLSSTDKLCSTSCGFIEFQNIKYKSYFLPVMSFKIKFADDSVVKNMQVPPLGGDDPLE